jgi:very-short-patch-repair endonuclease
MTESMPLTRAQALRRGHTVKELRGPRFRRLFRGVYVPAGEPVSLAQRARAALLVAPPGAYASHHTAARLWGAVAPDTGETHISVPGLGTRSVRDGIAAHRAETTFPPTELRGLPLSAPVAVFLELATLHLDLVALVVLGDSLVRRARITPESLVVATAGWAGRGARLARRAAGLVRTGVDSAMESRLRLFIVLAGLPEPQVNFVVRNAVGDWAARFDLCYPQLKLIIEYDGEHHRLDADQWSSDLKRREWLERQGWRIIVINSDAYHREPRETLARIRQALADRGCRDLPVRTPAVWDRLFARKS